MKLEEYHVDQDGKNTAMPAVTPFLYIGRLYNEKNDF